MEKRKHTTEWMQYGVYDMKIPGMDLHRFLHKLGKIVKVVLTIPHLNAGEEHVFSVIQKIKRDDRGKLQLQGRLSSLLYVKLNLPEIEKPCYDFNPTPQLLKLARELLHIAIRKCVFNHPKTSQLSKCFVCTCTLLNN